MMTQVFPLAHAYELIMDMRYMPLCVIIAFAAFQCKGEAPEPTVASQSSVAGRVESLVGTATATRGDDKERPLQVGDSVYSDDLITTMSEDTEMSIVLAHNNATWTVHAPAGSKGVVSESIAWSAKTHKPAVLAKTEETKTAGAGRDGERTAADPKESMDQSRRAIASKPGNNPPTTLGKITASAGDENDVDIAGGGEYGGEPSDGEASNAEIGKLSEALPVVEARGHDTEHEKKPEPDSALPKTQGEASTLLGPIQRKLETCGTLGGPIKLRFRVNRKGHVTLSSGGDKPLKRCVKKAVRSIRLGAQDASEEITVSITAPTK